jgi:hypothetical protein
MPARGENRSFWGFYDKGAIADRFGVTPRCVNQWKGEIPLPYLADAEDPEKFEYFPIDAPPEGLGAIIGDDLVRATNFMRRGDPEVAYALAVLVLNDNALQFGTGVAHGGKLLVVRKHYANMLQCMALARHPWLEPGRQALMVMRGFRRELINHLKVAPIAKNHPHYYVWKYMVAMADAYWMTYLGIRYAMDNEDQSILGRRLRVAEHVLKHAEPERAKSERVLDLVKQLPKVSHARCFVVFNLIQYAAVAKNVFIFNRCLKQLAVDYRLPYFEAYLIPMLKEDDDTGLMLEISEVKDQVRELMRGLDDNAA